MSIATLTRRDLDAKIKAYKTANPSATHAQAEGDVILDLVAASLKAANEARLTDYRDLSQRLKHANSKLTSQQKQMQSLVQSVTDLLALTKAAGRPAQPPGYQMPHHLASTLTKAEDDLAEAYKHLRADIADFQRREAQALAEKQAAAKERSDYVTAVSGNYATATAAIARRKAAIAQAGTVFTYGLGAEVKALFDENQKTLFSFEAIPSDTVDHDGQQYRILSVSPVIQGGAAGYIYRLQYAGNRPLFGQR